MLSSRYIQPIYIKRNIKQTTYKQYVSYNTTKVKSKILIVKCSNDKIKINTSVVKSTINWFGWTVVYNIYNKNAVMNIDTSLVTATQLTIATFMTYINSINVHTQEIKITNKNALKWFTCLFILSIGQYYGNYFGNLATTILNISSVNIIKSSEPIVSMIIMYFLFKQKQTIYKILLIFPIIFGISLCSVGDITYSHYGAILCTLSNIFHIFKIIISKKYFIEDLNYQSKTLFVLSMGGSFILSIPILITNWNILFTLSTTNIMYLILSSVGYYYNSIAAFDLITKVPPVSFSVLNIYKRIVIIAAFFILQLQIPDSKTLCGLLMSNVGLYLYMIQK